MLLLKETARILIPHQLIYFFKKYISINFFLFGPARRQGTYLVEQTDTSRDPFRMPDTLPALVKQGFSETYESYKRKPGFLRQYLLCQEDCYVEPEAGWGISQNGSRPVFDSIAYNTWKEAYHPGYFRFRKECVNAVRLDEAVSINIIPGGESNYWHFLHDLLGQVFLALEYLPETTPMLISSTLAQKPYFKEALKLNPRLAGLNWTVRDGYFLLKKAWFLQVMPNSHVSLFRFKTTLLLQEQTKPTRKIFLIRSSSRIRYIENTAQLIPIAERYGLEIVDADLLSLAEQIDLFSQTKLLVGIHGAGLTNMVFGHSGSMTVLELLPGNYIQPHYCWLSADCDFVYACLVGSKSGANTSFHLSPLLFEQKLSELLKA